MQVPVGAVEYGVRGRRPFGAGRELRSVGVDAPCLQFALRRFVFVHGLQLERSLFGYHDDRSEGFAGPEDVGASLRRRLEDAEEHHRPPVADQGRHRYWNGIGTIGIESRMRLGANREALLDLEIQQQLIGVEAFAEVAERWPLKAAVGRIAPLAFEMQAAFLGRYVSSLS